ncbi:MAG: phospho-N-acetylmuramoyl-pentapeptide-transferase [Clostridia bacterium]|nr:phospho-N-acetylmuramoyl-pentapeptide-transferase [Clostridia bacterium]
MFQRLFIEFAIVLVSSFILTAILSHFIIPILRKKHIGQSIRAEGPSWHQGKAGTPTMGGICFIIAMIVVGAVMAIVCVKRDGEDMLPFAMAMLLALLNGIIGLFDDYCKLLKKQNEGLKAHQKFFLQCLTAAAYVYVMKLLDYVDTSVHIPFTNIEVELGIIYYVFAMLTIVGMVNSVNLTDGLDGLASSITFVVAAFFSIVAFTLLNTSLAIFGGLIVGAMVGFLLFNRHPAKVFMGDTGSLFLGGAVTGAAFMINEPLIIFIAGGVYLFEVISVMLQVWSFKTRSKRIFLMTPVHHHLERRGWSENKIVIVFSLITAALCVVAYFGI